MMENLEQILKRIHAERYETNDKGFGRLYADIFKDKHRYNPQRKDFMLYDGKRWIDDTEGLAAKTDAKLLSDALVRFAISVDEQGKYLKSVMPLCNIRNRNNMLQDSKDIYYLSNEELDRNDYTLNVQNGILDLSEDEPKFMEHNPNMLLSKICNAQYEPSAKCERWERFLNEVLENDTEKIRYLQKIAGLSLTGNTEEETCFILFGKSTRNGKSTFCESLIHLLGDYAVSMKPESLAQKQNIDSRQASGDIARLAGCRLCNASEPPKRMLFDTALLKTLLGRDSITCRHLYQREFSFVPKFTLLMNTNYLPTITDDTVFSSGRINVISFNRHFRPEEQDKHLKSKLQSQQEMSGILNWCIRGLYLYRQEGLKPPKIVQDDTALKEELASLDAEYGKHFEFTRNMYREKLAAAVADRRRGNANKYIKGYFDFDLLNKMNIISQSEVQLTEDELASFCKDAMKSRSEFCVRKVQLMAEQNGFRLNVPSEAKANAVLDEVAKTASEVIDKFTGELTGKENGGTGRDGTSMKIRVHAEGTFLNRYEQQYEKETVEDVRISRISKQGFAEMEANKQKKADQEPVELVNADGVHVTAQSNGTNSAAAYFAKNYSNCMNQKTTEPED